MEFRPRIQFLLKFCQLWKILASPRYSNHGGGNVTITKMLNRKKKTPKPTNPARAARPVYIPNPESPREFQASALAPSQCLHREFHLELTDLHGFCHLTGGSAFPQTQLLTCGFSPQLRRLRCPGGFSGDKLGLAERGLLVLNTSFATGGETAPSRPWI